jgi:hypothetical protein
MKIYFLSNYVRRWGSRGVERELLTRAEGVERRETAAREGVEHRK